MAHTFSRILILSFLLLIKPVNGAVSCTAKLKNPSALKNGKIPQEGANLDLSYVPSSGAWMNAFHNGLVEANYTLFDRTVNFPGTVRRIHDPRDQNTCSFSLQQEGIVPPRCTIQLRNSEVLEEGMIPQKGGTRLLSFIVNPSTGARVVGNPQGTVPANTSSASVTRQFRAIIEDQVTGQPAFCQIELQQKPLRTKNCCLCQHSADQQCQNFKANFFGSTGRQLCFSACEVPNLAEGNPNRYIIEASEVYRKGYARESSLGRGFRSWTGSDQYQCYDGTIETVDPKKVRYRLEILYADPSASQLTVRVMVTVIRNEKKLTNPVIKNEARGNPPLICGDNFVHRIESGGRLQYDTLYVRHSTEAGFPEWIPNVLEVGDTLQEVTYFSSVLEALNRVLQQNYVKGGTGSTLLDPRTLNAKALEFTELKSSMDTLVNYANGLKAITDPEVLKLGPQQYFYVRPINFPSARP